MGGLLVEIHDELLQVSRVGKMLVGGQVTSSYLVSKTTTSYCSAIDASRAHCGDAGVDTGLNIISILGKTYLSQSPAPVDLFARGREGGGGRRNCRGKEDDLPPSSNLPAIPAAAAAAAASGLMSRSLAFSRWHTQN